MWNGEKNIIYVKKKNLDFFGTVNIFLFFKVGKVEKKKGVSKKMMLIDHLTKYVRQPSAKVSYKYE